MAAGFSISIGAIDNVTKVVNRINNTLGAQQKRFSQLSAPIRRLTSSFKELGEKTGLNNLSKAFTPIANGAKRAASAVTSLIAPLGALTSAASIAGVSALVTQWSNFGRSLNNNAQLLNTSTKRLQTFESVGQQFGMNAGDMTSSIDTLGHSMQDALMGRAPEAAQILSSLGINFRKTQFQAISGAEGFDRVRDAISKITDPQMRLAAAQKIFGDNARSLMPILSATTEEYAEYQKQAESYVLGPEQTEGANAFARSLNLLQQSVSHFTNSLSAGLAPIIQPIIEQLRTFIDLWSQPDNIKIVVDYIKEFGVYALNAVKTINDIVQSFGGWINVIKALAAIQIMTWVTGLAVALAPLIGIIAALTTGFITLTVAMLSNPVGLVIAGVVALGVAAYELYEHWEPVKKFFIGLWDSILGVFDRAWKKITGMFSRMKWFTDKLGITSSDNTVTSNTLGETAPGQVQGGGMYAPGGDGGAYIPGTSGGPVQPSTPFKGSQNEYYQKRYDELLAAAKERGVPNPEVVARLGAAQSSQETGYGQHYVGNNMFGIKAGAGQSSVTAGTDEVINGQRVHVDQNFAAYQSQSDSSKDYIDFLMRNKRYQGILNAKTDDEAIAALKSSGYATDPNYADSIRGIESHAMASRTNSFVAQPPPQAGSPAGPVTAGTAPNGQVQVTVSLTGAPPGTTATASAQGSGIKVEPPRVSAMALVAPVT